METFSQGIPKVVNNMETFSQAKVVNDIETFPHIILIDVNNLRTFLLVN